MLNYNDLPNTMYFGSSKQIPELKNKVFLTPHKGIASLFIIDDIFPKDYKINCNIGYRQWDYSNDLLTEPLKTINVIHNIEAFKNEIFTGKSSGYIYTIDISKVKDKISLFDTNDSDREVIYNDAEPLIIINCNPCTVQWDFRFSQDVVEKYGVGTAEKIK